MSNFPPALILAGGASSRMGREKAFLDVAGKTMLRRIIERLEPQVGEIAINANPGNAWPAEYKMLPDTISGRLGPLAGILAGLEGLLGSGHSHLVTVPSDCPFLPLDLVLRLQEACADSDTVIVASSLGQLHPVFGLWPFTLAKGLREWLESQENRSILGFINQYNMVAVDFMAARTPNGPLDPFFNINTVEDLEMAQTHAETLD